MTCQGWGWFRLFLQFQNSPFFLQVQLTKIKLVLIFKAEVQKRDIRKGTALVVQYVLTSKFPRSDYPTKAVNLSRLAQGRSELHQ